MQIFLVLMISASCSLLFSMLFLIPVIKKVKKNKQEVLELFLHRKIEKHINEQLTVCRNFAQRFQTPNDNEQEMAEQEDANGEEANTLMKRMKKS